MTHDWWFQVNPLHITMLCQDNWVMKWFPQCGILRSVDSYEPVKPPFKLRNSKCCTVSCLTVIEYSSDLQRLLSDWAYMQADLSLCWSHLPNCSKSHVAIFVWFNSLCPINNLSVKKGRVFLGWTSTKLG